MLEVTNRQTVKCVVSSLSMCIIKNLDFIFSKNKLMYKYMELIREIYEDKKLTAFLKKRTKEYEHKTSGLSSLEAVQHYKDEIEVI